MPIMSNEQSKHIMVKDITHEYIVQLFMIIYDYLYACFFFNA